MKICNEECEHCIYIGEGDYMCDIYNKMVGEDFSIDTVCLKENNNG